MAEYIKFKDNGDDDSSNEKKYKRRRSRFSFRTFILILIGLFLLSSIISSISYSLTPKIAVVKINGPIMIEEASTLYGSSISSREIATTIRNLESDSSVKAILLDINSPGGSPVASEEISQAIENVKKSKPVYALINDVGASGAFWIAVSTDKIYASSMSTVGSIGVTSAGLGFEDFIKEHNISYRRLVAGEHKDMGTYFRNLTEEEESIIQEILDEIHVNFINHVATSRNMTYEEVEQYATGRIFLGSTAKEIGFVDEIGYYPDVIADLKKQTGEVIIAEYGPTPTFWEELGLNAIFDFSPSTFQNQILI